MSFNYRHIVIANKILFIRGKIKISETAVEGMLNSYLSEAKYYASYQLDLSNRR